MSDPDRVPSDVLAISDQLCARHRDEVVMAQAYGTCVGFMYGVVASGLFALAVTVGPTVLSALLGPGRLP